VPHLVCSCPVCHVLSVSQRFAWFHVGASCKASVSLLLGANNACLKITSYSPSFRQSVLSEFVQWHAYVNAFWQYKRFPGVHAHPAGMPARAPTPCLQACAPIHACLRPRSECRRRGPQPRLVGRHRPWRGLQAPARRHAPGHIHQRPQLAQVVRHNQHRALRLQLACAGARASAAVNAAPAPRSATAYSYHVWV